MAHRPSKPIKLKLPKIGKPSKKANKAKASRPSRVPKPHVAPPSKDRMANARRDPNTGRPTDPNTGQPINKAPNSKLAKGPKKQTVKDNHLRVIFQITNVEEAKNEEGVIVRKVVDAVGPRGSSINFEVNDPVHHDMLENGKFLSVEMKEVSGHNA